MYGYLVKKGEGVLAKSKRRYFALDGGRMHYYESEDSAARWPDLTSLGQIELTASSTVVPVTSTRLAITSRSGRVFDLESETSEERDAWIKAVRATIASMVAQAGGPELAGAAARKASSPVSAVGAPVGAGTGSAEAVAAVGVGLTGFLTKKGEGITSKAKRRFFVLEEDRIDYYDKEGEGADYLGTIDLASSSTVRASAPARMHVSSKSGRVYDLDAATAAERDTWVESVRLVVYSLASAAAQRG